MPDNYLGDFLSHHMKPIEQMLGLRIEVELEVAYGITAIGQKRDLLVQLVALGLEHLEEAAFGFLVIGLDESKTLAGDWRFDLFPSVKREETLARDHLKATLLPLGFHVAAVNADRQRPVREG